jgi:hypothetical protein
MAVPEVKYAIYPGTTPVYNEDGDYVGDATFTAEELATAYGVEGEDYLTVENDTWSLQDMAYFEYIHLKPRSDGKYINMLTQVEEIYRPDFDSKKRYTEETDPRAIDPEVENDLEENQRNGDFR